MNVKKIYTEHDLSYLKSVVKVSIVKIKRTKLNLNKIICLVF